MVWFRQHDERHVSGEIKIMKWNPKMDIICLATSSGEVALHRLIGWQKLKAILPPLHSTKPGGKGKTAQENDFAVTAIEWRPDGKVIAVGYNTDIHKMNKEDAVDDTKSSSVALVDVESAEIIHVIEVTFGKVSCLCWSSSKLEKSSTTDETKFSNNAHIEFLPKLKPLPKSYSSSGPLWSFRKMTEDNIDDLLQVATLDDLNMLVIGTNSGKILIYAFGVYLCGVLSLPGHPVITYLALSDDFGLLQALAQSTYSSASPPACSSSSLKKFSILTFKIPMLRENKPQLKTIAQIYAQIISLSIYLNETIQAVLEKWEDILLEIDSKLSNYVQKQDDETELTETTSLSADEFLELLVFGIASDSLEKFLSKLTDKGLKKLGHSIELTYSDIQKLVVKNVQKVSYHIFCHLNTLRGIALWTCEFGEIGLDINAINKAIKSVGSFFIKSVELQQVIGASVGNVKPFFRWLLSVMLRLFSDSIPPSQQDVTKISQQDIQFVSEFIQENFESELSSHSQSDHCSRPTTSNFTLERVGQYFKDKNLAHIESAVNKNSLNPWVQFNKERHDLTNYDDSKLLLFTHNAEKSLIQEHKIMDQNVKDAFHGPSIILNKSVRKHESQLVHLISIPHEDSPVITHVTNFTNKSLLLAFLNTNSPAEEMYIVKYALEQTDDNKIGAVGAKFYLTEDRDGTSSVNMKILDIHFYSETILSLLLAEANTNVPYLVQFPFSCLNSNYKPLLSQLSSCNLTEICVPINIDLNNELINYRKLDNMRASFLAVSGSRKVSCVAFASKRRIRLFEMDSIEEEDEQELEYSDVLGDVENIRIDNEDENKENL